ncbi:hypothetical protein B0H13DRAFT_1933897 [Mycena leptocephala]|nr:hypothetical protein B0H13DRAFT_1933897 [Mycena leptocephala]
MAVLGTAQMTVTIARSVLEARFVQQVVLSQLLNEDKALSEFSVLSLRTIRDFTLFINRLIWTLVVSLLRDMGSQRKILLVPALLILSTFVVGIVVSAAAKFSISTLQITLSMSVATNLALTALTGKLESGAIYCITAIFLVITASLYEEGIFAIGLSIAQQLINIIPTFTLVYVGLNNTDYSQPKEHAHQVPSTSRSAVVRPCQPCEVLDIKPQSKRKTENVYEMVRMNDGFVLSLLSQVQFRINFLFV